MKKTILLLLIPLLLLTGCAAKKNNDLTYYSNEEKENLRQQLTQVLMKLCTDVEKDMRFALADGVWVGLFDIDCDGVPEVVEGQPGGSAGNVFLHVYGLASGKELGVQESGFLDHYDHGCLRNCLNTNDGTCRTFLSFSQREGANAQSFFLSELTVDAKTGKTEQKLLFRARQEFLSVSAGENEGPFEAPIYEYWLNGEKVSREEYDAAYTELFTTYRELPETACLFFSWEDIAAESDEELTRKMADLLLTSSQNLIKASE